MEDNQSPYPELSVVPPEVPSPEGKKPVGPPIMASQKPVGPPKIENPPPPVEEESPQMTSPMTPAEENSPQVENSLPPVEEDSPQAMSPPAPTEADSPEAMSSSASVDEGSRQEGEGLTLNHKLAEKVVISLEKGSELGLEETPLAEINFVAGAACKIKVAAPAPTPVGEDMIVTLLAIDDYGNHDEKFSGSVKINGKDSLKGLDVVHFHHGVATAKLQSHIAEKTVITLSDCSEAGIDLSEEIEVLFLPGSAVKLEMKEPTEVVAGADVTLSIRAVDQYGNTDTNFNQTVTLKIAGSEVETKTVELKNGIVKDAA